MVLFLYAALVRLTFAPTPRLAFYSALLTGIACYAPHLAFFLRIFGPIAFSLWTILAIWICIFCAAGPADSLNPRRAIVAVELFRFRSSGPALSISAANFITSASVGSLPGIAFGNGWLIQWAGVYGAGFIFDGDGGLACCSDLAAQVYLPSHSCRGIGFTMFFHVDSGEYSGPVYQAVGIQLENPTTGDVIEALDKAVKDYPNVTLLMLSEYSLDSPPPESIKSATVPPRMNVTW